jgi:hypothetical protein
MASEYLLPTVSNKTTSPLASRRSSSTSHDGTRTSYTLPQLPSFKSNTSRSSIGSSNDSVRYPLSNIQMNNLDNTPRTDMDIDSAESVKKVAINIIDEAKPDILDTTEAMQIDQSVVKTITEEKSMDMYYPSQSKLPPRSLVQALYDEAVSLNVHGGDASDQLDLCDAGLLSFEQVLLPAVAYQEEQMLKEWQSIVQRDGSTAQKATVVALRKTVYSGIGAACAAVRKSRQSRAKQDREREMIWQKEAEERRAVEQAQRQKQQAIIDNEYREALRQRQRDLQKQLPANQEVWREVAYLMTELTKLSNEERQWRNVATQYFDRTEADLVEHEKQLKDTQHSLDVLKPDGNINVPSEAVQQLVDDVTDSASDITLAVDRIRNALHHVSNTVFECEQSRQQLYHQYVSNHQFYGYQGVHDPKGLLKVLSQSQSDD